MSKKAIAVRMSLAWILALLAAPAPAKDAPAKAADPKAPAFALKDHQGKTVRLSDQAGKIVVLEWINPDCPYSRRHQVGGTMKTLAAKYAPRGVVWLAVNSTKTWTATKNRAWAEKNKVPYAVLDDHAGDVGRLYGAKSTPDMRIVDGRGRIVYRGAIDDDPHGKAASPTNHVAAALEDLLAGKKVSTPRTKPYGCSVKYAPAVARTPAFALADHTGKTVRLGDFAGKIVVLEWINPDCPVSRGFYTNGAMKALAARYAPRGVVWLAVNSTHYFTTAKNARWVAQHALPYPILNDQSGKVGRAYGAKTTPDMRVLDRSGALAYQGAIDNRARGDKAVNYVAKALDELLAGKKVSIPRSKPYGCSVKYAPKPK